ncbi:MAG TPA: hypothetical protein VK901_05455 [Nitrospiraceae bacterium]|nr:hypothetical protein [Nitrospiraceae bacterium]
MPNRRERACHTAVLGLLLLTAMAMQGCLALVWLGAVGIDMTRTSDIEFQSFENSWVIAPQDRQQPGLVQSVAVMPFLGDPVMAERWIAVFREVSDLRVVSLSYATRHRVPDHEVRGLAKRMSAEPQMDCMLDGSVVNQVPQKGFAGLTERSSRRLSLHLLSADGTLLWKTELPYTIVTGSKDLDEEMVMKALLTHVRAHANKLGLAELGATTMQAASRSLHDTPDNHMGSPMPGFERPR